MQGHLIGPPSSLRLLNTYHYGTLGKMISTEGINLHHSHQLQCFAGGLTVLEILELLIGQWEKSMIPCQSGDVMLSFLIGQISNLNACTTVKGPAKHSRVSSCMGASLHCLWRINYYAQHQIECLSLCKLYRVCCQITTQLECSGEGKYSVGRYTNYTHYTGTRRLWQQAGQGFNMVTLITQHHYLLITLWLSHYLLASYKGP